MKITHIDYNIVGRLFMIDGEEIVFFPQLKKLILKGEEHPLRSQEVSLLNLILNNNGVIKSSVVVASLGIDLNTISVLKRNITNRIKFEMFEKHERDFVKLREIKND